MPGSSPRTRGTYLIWEFHGHPVRFIPAYTGNIRFQVPVPRGMSVHPRVHGEHVIHRRLMFYLYGSSPRTRGTCTSYKARYEAERFIPAYTGNICARRFSEKIISVHPRVHGEHRTSSQHIPPQSGSSPRTRGTFMEGNVVLLLIRFIPAYTGNIEIAGSRGSFGAVHPRVHGEHSLAGFDANADPGSSPRTRGTSHRAREAGRQVRFIPAYTGNISFLISANDVWSVHPRVHGEHIIILENLLVSIGSSPRTRGT